ncbi:putative glycine-rich cell wall structural protein 1 [Senna tora]|uniref:Putative glycine-rich cell wall structural protein 1 n=1 Tax=Senna tora TaxID=362788 RepID=A0A834SZX5_9FABA|nr:putative glycine-rich cell wall structural protein 1 [Senna tora]
MLSINLLIILFTVTFFLITPPTLAAYSGRKLGSFQMSSSGAPQSSGNPAGATGSAHGPNWDYSWGWGSGPGSGWGYGFGSGRTPSGGKGRGSGFGYGFSYGGGSDSGTGYSYGSGDGYGLSGSTPSSTSRGRNSHGRTPIDAISYIFA